MSRQTNAQRIYTALLAAGLTHAGACAMIANWDSESGLIPNNVEDRLHKDTGMSDAEYTAAVDNGSYPNFANDGYGYGYYQLTFSTRKLNFLSFVRERGESIGNGDIQTDFAIHELRTEYEYRDLYSFLCSTNDLYTAVSRICKEFERPAENNIGDRYGYAKTWDKVLSGQVLSTAPAPVPETAAPIVREDFTLSFRYLKYGCVGEDVRAWQRQLKAGGFDIGQAGADGIFLTDTAKATEQYQHSIQKTPDRIVGPDTLGYMLGIS